jgi:hypothetical protein
MPNTEPPGTENFSLQAGTFSYIYFLDLRDGKMFFVKDRFPLSPGSV